MGRKVKQTVEGLGIGRASYYRWRNGDPEGAVPVQNPRALIPEELTLIDRVKEQQPHLRHRRIQGAIQAMGVYLSASSVYGHLKAQGWDQSYERRPAPWKEPRYEVFRRNVMWGVRLDADADCWAAAAERDQAADVRAQATVLVDPAGSPAG